MLTCTYEKSSACRGLLGEGENGYEKAADRRGNRAVVCFMVVLWAWGGIVREWLSGSA